MALQVWLPLNGDIKNLGLDDITITSQSISGFTDSGKIGKALTLLNSYYYMRIPTLTNATVFSCAFWYKKNANSSYTVNWRRIVAFETQREGESNGLFRFESSYGSVNYDVSVHSNAAYQICPSGTGNRPLVSNSNDWHHIAVVVSGEKISFYVDGNMVNTGDQTTGSLTGLVSICQTGSQADGWLNDLRIYDHCLSPKEVKELSKGLVAHYPLNDGVGGENLIKDSYAERTCEYPSSGVKDFYAPITTKVPSGTTYTLSFYAKSTVNGDHLRTHYYSPNTTTTCVSSQGITKTASDGNMDFVLTTEWKYYWVVYNQSETTAVKHVICPRLISQAYASWASGTGVVSVKMVKFEEGSLATPWIPNPADDTYSKLGFDLEVWGENYMPNSVEMAYGTANPSTGTWRNAGSSTMTKSRVQINDSPIGTCYAFQNVGIQTPNDGSCYGIDSFPMDANCDYTISMYARIVSGTEGYAGFNIYSISSEIGGTYTKVDKGYRVTPLAPDGSWTLCTYSVHTNSSTKRNIYIGITTGSTSVTTQMCLVKIEKGSIATPWITNQNDAHPMRINNEIIYDCSGYGHNGSLVGECTTDTDSPRYSCSKHITSDDPNSSSINSESISYIVAPVALTTPECMSIAWWGYHNPSYNGGKHGVLATSSLDVPSDYLATAFNHRDSGYDVNASDSTHIRLSDSIVFGGWHHYVITYDGQTSKTYTDGVQVNSAAFDAKKALHSFNKIFFGYSTAGGVNRRNTGNYSDIRIYATALSAEDVKNLYETTASIDDHNNIYAHELWEA